MVRLNRRGLMTSQPDQTKSEYVNETHLTAATSPPPTRPLPLSPFSPSLRALRHSPLISLNDMS